MIVIVDAMNLFFIELGASVSILRKEGKELDKENFPFFINVLMNRVNNIFSTYENVYFAWEGKNSTKRRKDIFPEYKGNRGKNKEEEHYKLAMEFVPKFQEIIKSYPSKSIIVEGCEADDVIYVLSSKYKNEGVLILSTDGDLVQIGEKFGAENVQMYNPVKKKFIEKKNVVLEKAIVGDKGDNIPGISGIGEKTFQKMIDDKDFFEKTMAKGNNRKIFEQFLEVVDLSKIPKELEEAILSQDESLEFSKFDPDTIEQFFWNNKSRELLGRWGTAKTKIINVSKEE